MVCNAIENKREAHTQGYMQNMYINFFLYFGPNTQCCICDFVMVIYRQISYTYSSFSQEAENCLRATSFFYMFSIKWFALLFIGSGCVYVTDLDKRKKTTCRTFFLCRWNTSPLTESDMFGFGRNGPSVGYWRTRPKCQFMGIWKWKMLYGKKNGAIFQMNKSIEKNTLHFYSLMVLLLGFF